MKRVNVKHFICAIEINRFFVSYPVTFSVERIRNAGIAGIVRERQSQVGRNANAFGQHGEQMSFS